MDQVDDLSSTMVIFINIITLEPPIWMDPSFCCVFVVVVAAVVPLLGQAAKSENALVDVMLAMPAMRHEERNSEASCPVQGPFESFEVTMFVSFFSRSRFSSVVFDGV